MSQRPEVSKTGQDSPVVQQRGSHITRQHDVAVASHLRGELVLLTTYIEHKRS